MEYLLKQHIITAIGFILYCLLWLNHLKLSDNFREGVRLHGADHEVALGEASMYDWLLVIMLGGAFTMIMLINVTINRKQHRWFYLAMALITALLVVGLIIF